MEDLDKLHQKIDELSDELIEMTFQVKNSKEAVLLEFVRELYQSLQRADYQDEDADLWFENITKEEIIDNLKKYIRRFAEDNKIRL